MFFKITTAGVIAGSIHAAFIILAITNTHVTSIPILWNVAMTALVAGSVTNTLVPDPEKEFRRIFHAWFSIDLVIIAACISISLLLVMITGGRDFLTLAAGLGGLVFSVLALFFGIFAIALTQGPQQVKSYV